MKLPTTNANGVLWNMLLRVLSFGILVLAVRFAYVVTLTGGSCGSQDFCFFPDDVVLRSAATVHPQASSAVSAGVGDSRLCDLWATKKWRAAVDYYSSLFQDFVPEGFLSPDSKALCVDDTLSGEDVLALKEIGIVDSVGISKKASSPLVVSGESHRLPFDANTFDFVFAGNSCLDRSLRPLEFASEVGRTLKPGGFLVVHTTAKDSYSFSSFLDLFDCCSLVRSREIDGTDFSSVREIVMKKEAVPRCISSVGDKCSSRKHKSEIIRNAEPIIKQEPLKPWTTLKRNIKYLTSMVDISFKRRYVYVDVGARSYGSSIGSWFKKNYPKQNKTFEVYAIEADKAFHEEYKTKKGVVLLPYAAWVRNETLFFEITRDQSDKAMAAASGRGMGRVQRSTSYMLDGDKIEGFDFAEWLKKTVSGRDYVVVKMDVEGTEFHLIPRLIETGAMCLIDELFLECHYNRWQRCCPGQRNVKYQKTYGQCLKLFTSLRESGVLVHQWW